jgi:hypothetical protein
VTLALLLTTRAPPRVCVHDMVGQIYIRGGYYDGHEETWLDSVVLQEGNHAQDAMLRE